LLRRLAKQQARIAVAARDVKPLTSYSLITKVRNKMTMSDLKIYFLNASAFALSYSQLDMILKVMLLVLSIGYTAQRWYLLDKERRNKNNEGNK